MSTPARSPEAAEVAEIQQLARPLRTSADLDPLVTRVGDARFVLLGEASHGTAEFYGWRAALTRRLIAERGFSFVAVGRFTGTPTTIGVTSLPDRSNLLEATTGLVRAAP